MRELFIKYVRFVIAAAALAIASMLVLEAIGWLVPYDSPLVHGCIVTAIYLAGVYINFHIQRLWVFETSKQASLIKYALWMFGSGAAVGLVAGVAFDVLVAFAPSLPLIPSLSLAVALALVSPLTFYGVSIIMKEEPHSR